MLLPDFIRTVLKHSSTLKIPEKFLLKMSDLSKNQSLKIIAPEYFTQETDVTQNILPTYNNVTTLQRNALSFHDYQQLAVTGVNNDVWYKYTDDFKRWILHVYIKSKRISLKNKFSITVNQPVYVRSYPLDEKLRGVVIGIHDFYIVVDVPSLNKSLCVHKSHLEKIPVVKIIF